MWAAPPCSRSDCAYGLSPSSGSMISIRACGPSWQSAANRALITTLLFVAVVVFVLKQPMAQAIALGGFMLLLYIPIGYYTDSYFYNRRQRALKNRGGK